ncbi:MAG: rod-binding protein [Lachnospiraceae bacterium]
MSVTIDSLAGAYTQAAAGDAVSQKLEKNLKSDLSNASDEELMDVCKEFEAYFTEQVFKAMEKMVPESEETSASNRQLKEYYKDQMIKEYASASAEGQGLGIAQMMFEQMKRNYDI